MPRNAHASCVNEMLRNSGEETFECAECGDLHLDRGHAVMCCSDEVRDSGGDSA